MCESGTLLALDVVLGLYCVASKAFSWFDGALVHPTNSRPTCSVRLLTVYSGFLTSAARLSLMSKDITQASVGRPCVPGLST